MCASRKRNSSMQLNCYSTALPYNIIVTVPRDYSGLSQMLVTIPLPMHITQLNHAWLEGIRECRICFMEGHTYIHPIFMCYTSTQKNEISMCWYPTQIL